MAHKFEIYRDKAGEFRVRFRYNNEIMFSTEGYSNKSSAKNAVNSIKNQGPSAAVEYNYFDSQEGELEAVKLADTKVSARPTKVTGLRKRIDKAMLQALTADLPPPAQDAADLVRSMRDDERY